MTMGFWFLGPYSLYGFTLSALSNGLAREVHRNSGRIAKIFSRQPCTTTDGSIDKGHISITMQNTKRMANHHPRDPSASERGGFTAYVELNYPCPKNRHKLASWLSQALNGLTAASHKLVRE